MCTAINCVTVSALTALMMVKLGVDYRIELILQQISIISG